MNRKRPLRQVVLGYCLLFTCGMAAGQSPESAKSSNVDHPQHSAAQLAPLAPLPDKLSKLIQKATPLNPSKTVLLNRSKKRVYLHTQVSCRNCVLEMLCVPIGEREHETILNIRARAFTVHAALLAMNMEPGKPAAFYPDYQPPEGPQLTLRVHWVDANGKKRTADARSWIRHSIHRYFSQPLVAAPPGIELPHEELRYDKYNKELLWYGPMTKDQREHLLTLWDDEKYQAAIQKFYELSQSRAMTASFLFTGSRWNTNKQTGERRYAAEDGHFITVANFPSSTIDIAEESSASDGGQTYEGWETKIPPEGTAVILEIMPAARKPQPKPSNPQQPAKDKPQSTESPTQTKNTP